MTVWYADWERRSLHVYGTSGYDYGYRGWNELNLDESETGWATMRAIRGVKLHHVDDPLTAFANADQARLQGINEAFMSPVSHIENPERHEDVLGSLNMYFYGNSRPIEEAVRCEVAEALPQLAHFIGRLFVAYREARRRFVAELIKLKLDNPPEEIRSSKSRLYALRMLVNEFFGPVVASSIWIVHNQRLYCADSDRLFRFNPPLRSDVELFPPSARRKPPFEQDAWGPLYYDLNDQSHRGFTTALASYGDGQSNLQRRVLCQKVNGYCPQQVGKPTLKPSGRFSEHFGVEHWYDRRFLGISILNQDGRAIGVLRVVRPGEGRPFTRCDEDLIETIAHGATSVIQGWQKELSYYLDELSQETRTLEEQLRWAKRSNDALFAELPSKSRSAMNRSQTDLDRLVKDITPGYL
jgi:hypothetical protein